MSEYINPTKGIQRQQLKAFLRINRAQAAFNVQPKFRNKCNETKLEQISHGFGITRYNKNKHK